MKAKEQKKFLKRHNKNFLSWKNKTRGYQLLEIPACITECLKNSVELLVNIAKCIIIKGKNVETRNARIEVWVKELCIDFEETLAPNSFRMPK